MLGRISWGSFLSTIGWLLAAYYAIVLARFYRAEIKMLFSATLKGRQKKNAPAAAEKKDEFNNALDQAYKLRNEITGMFKEGDSLPVKEELAMAIQLKLRNYEEIKGTAFQAAINNHICTECENKCSIRFSEEELKRLWEK